MNYFPNFFGFNKVEKENINFIKCKPPINNLDKKEENVDDVKGEISTIFNEGKKIGNLAITSRSLSNDFSGIDLVVVMDVSGSMSSVAIECVQILQHSVDSLNSYDRLSIITFDSVSRQLFPLQPMTSNIKLECKKIIETCYTGGSTNLESAIDLLIKTKEDGMIQDRIFKVIILSDGQPDYGRDGFHLVERLYQGEIKPEVFSCTFGSNVKADTLKRLLLPQNAHYYKHISNMNEFKNLVTEIGLDKNVILGSNLKIRFRNIEPIISLPLNREEKWVELNIDHIKTDDIINLPLEYLEGENIIVASYNNKNAQKIEIQIEQSEGDSNFIIHHYWYKRILNMIQEVEKVDNREEKIEKLNQINTLINKEKLGDFLEEIKDMISKTRLMLENRNNYEDYNRYTSTINNISSFASPTINKVYKEYKKKC